MSEITMTVADLKRQLNGLADSTKLTFPGGLTFYRIKRLGDDEVFIEFNEAQADLTPEFKKRNPNVKVAFISMDSADWDKSGMVRSVNVTVR